MDYSYDRRVIASELVWRDISPEKISWRTTQYLVLEAQTPTGWTYRIKASKQDEEPDFDNWQVYVSEPGTNAEYDRRAKNVHVDGKAKRGFAILPSLDAAKVSAEKHYASVRGGWPTDPAEIVRKLTPAQRKLLIEAAENDGKVVMDYGLKSERPYRIWLTKTVGSLSQSGLLLNGWILTDLGKQVAKLLG